MVYVVIRLLEVIIQLHNVVFLIPPHHIRSDVLDNRLLATLRGSDTSLLTLQDASLDALKEIITHPLVDGKRHHLRDCGEAGDGTVIRKVLPVAAFIDEDRPSFQEPVILLVLSVSDFPLH